MSKSLAFFFFKSVTLPLLTRVRHYILWRTRLRRLRKLLIWYSHFRIVQPNEDLEMIFMVQYTIHTRWE